MGNIVNKIKLNARAAKIAAGSTATALLIGTSFAFAAPSASASSASAGGATAKGLVQNLLSYVFAIFRYIGWLLLAWGVGQLVLAFKNEDADSKSRAMMLIVVAVILTALTTIFNGVIGEQLDAEIELKDI